MRRYASPRLLIWPSRVCLRRKIAAARAAQRQPALCAEQDGFSLHAAVRVAGSDRGRLEQLCRYISRPALSEERLQRNAAGQVVLKLKTPWRDGTSHVVMTPIEFLQRLAALVPRRGLHLIRFHGVLAPNAKLRARVVPCPRPDPSAVGQDNEPAVNGGGDDRDTSGPVGQAARIRWAQLLRRVFDIDMKHCPNCGKGQLRVIAVVLDRATIRRILEHLGLQPQPPPRGR